MAEARLVLAGRTDRRALYPDGTTEEAGMRRVLKGIAWFVAATTVLRLVAEVLARRFEAGANDPTADDLRLAAFWGGRDLTSRAGALRTVSARIVFGGINLDLTKATLHPDGAQIDVDARLGGVNLVVPAGWRVGVVDHLRGGGISFGLPEDVDEDAPLLEIRVTGVAAGVNVEASH
jgi:hypothetical protein